MMERKEIVRYVLLILCAFVLFAIPWASVIGIQDPGLIETIRLFQRIAGVGILTYIVITIIYQIYQKSLAQEMKEEEIKEADQEDTRQSLFKPTIGVLIFFMIFTFSPAFDIIYSLIKNEVDFNHTSCSFVVITIFILMWYITPVFIFKEDSVQIKSFLFYFFRIDWKTVIKYTDIIAVKPAPKGKVGEEFRRYRLEIVMNGKKKINILTFYNSDIVAKIYLRFREKLGDKVKLE
ncbi:hypothetical protein E2N92_09850 [Methanofollis formosanus]|uniref:Uncharacterized protein n=1 Tax=Methanofollis formosanus TaxID=299308 RepID=A0A8G1A436_9EURY|nr:hypothetical protein [Methanofollis formosanus]QYZ79707.1 hypothetical protein E2N92_09850 [Methanofollis formosanus]